MFCNRNTWNGTMEIGTWSDGDVIWQLFINIIINAVRITRTTTSIYGRIETMNSVHIRLENIPTAHF